MNTKIELSEHAKLMAIEMLESGDFEILHKVNDATNVTMGHLVMVDNILDAIGASDLKESVTKAARETMLQIHSS
jgi:hypothetical protein